MRRKNENIWRIAFIITIFFTALFAAAIVFLIKQVNDTSLEYKSYKSDAESSFNGYADEAENAKKQILRLEDEKSGLEDQIKKVEAELQSTVASFENQDERYKELNKKLTELKDEVSDREGKIEKLKATITELERIYKIDLNTQGELLNELNDLLENQRPVIKYMEETINGEGETEYVEKERIPEISIYYEDINHGYTYSYNADKVYNSASLLKAPFALSILKAASLEAKKNEETVSEIADNELSQTEESSSEANDDDNSEFDLDEYIIYSSEMSQSGSGVIKDGEEDKKYTYLELIRYMLEYSDNVAFYQLKEKYGFDYFRELAYELDAKSLQISLADISANDGGKVMKAIYEFFTGDYKYSQLMKESMLVSNHTVMIPAGVYPTEVAHKYGWDINAYHDMAIVFDENPYVLVVLSDMDTGGKEVDAYIQNVVGLINKMHKNFYS